MPETESPSEDIHALHDLTVEIRVLLAVTLRLAGRDLEQRLSQMGLPISGLQHGVLRVLHHSPHNLSSLSQLLMLTPATLVPAVDALERHGLVQRTRDRRDRRRTQLSLTDGGKDAITRMGCLKDQNALEESLRKLGKERSQQLLGLLRELADNLSEEPGVADRVAEMVRQYHLPGMRPHRAE